MKKKIIPIIIISLIIGFFVGTTYKTYNTKSVDTTGESAKINEVDIFEKNKECYSYKDKIENEQREIGIEQNTLDQNGYVEAMFYSLKVNSCVYIFSISEHPYYKKDLVNVFTNDNYASYDYQAEMQDIETRQEMLSLFNKTVYEYKVKNN